MYNQNPNMDPAALGYTPQSLQIPGQYPTQTAAPGAPGAMPPGMGPAQMTAEPDTASPEYRQKMAKLAEMLRQEQGAGGGMGGAIAGGIGQGVGLGQAIQGLM
jgi:hypothetical protein